MGRSVVLPLVLAAACDAPPPAEGGNTELFQSPAEEPAPTVEETVSISEIAEWSGVYSAGGIFGTIPNAANTSSSSPAA